jgi:hypothetical protein
LHPITFLTPLPINEVNDAFQKNEMNIMNENDHTYEIENIDMKGTT